ncbi:thymidylate synthase (FAD) [Nakamurella sp. UYEF19]|uniref:FAD-dependent thymidylate synthase n=1 Tax=Nakamurella sp. UYEF19 TaxID=1756392 RepID=UPI00339771CB
MTDPRIRLIARTEFLPPDDVGFLSDAEGGQALAEFAGRACYQSWDRPNPATATNDGYLRHILQVGHLSVLEHSTATFYLTGISRAVTHEILRHRHFSNSELSPRFVPPGGPAVVEPDAVARNPALHEKFTAATEAAAAAHGELLAALEEAAEQSPDGTLARKQARQHAAGLLPAATTTALVVSGNYRAWRHFIGMRATEAADVEIRTLAVGVLRVLQDLAPSVFADFRISQLPDGTELAASPLVADA